MSNQSISVLALTVVATAALVPHRFVTGLGAYPTAAAGCLGVARSEAAIGDALPVDVIGTAMVEVSAAVAKDQLIQVGADGKGVPLAAGVKVARALFAADADTSFEVLLITN
jgi:hypothetical protein